MQEFFLVFLSFSIFSSNFNGAFFILIYAQQKHIKTKIEKISIGPRVRTNMHS